MTDARAALEIRGLTAGYGRIPVLHGIDLTVATDEIVGILGHNGMGKSTLLKTVMGFIPATGGTVRLDGEDITRLEPHQRSQRGIGYVPQGRGIFPKLSVRDNLRMAWHADTGTDEAEAVERVLADFPRVTRLLDRDGGALSGGEQQLLALARCLMGNPWLLLLDEPTEGIQPSIVKVIEQVILSLKRRITIVLVEQYVDFALGVADAAITVERGRTGAKTARADFDKSQLSRAVSI